MEWYPTPSYLVKRRAMLEFLATLPARSFLEVGCGAGDLLQALAERGYRGLGIDLSVEAVAAARTRVDPARVRVERMELENVDGCFEIVVASEVLEHWADDVAFLRALRRRTCEGGHLLLTVPAHMEKWGANDELCGHVRRYGREELRAKLTEAGMETILIHSYGVPIYNLMKPFYDRAVKREIREGEGGTERTGKSGGMRVLPGLSLLFRLLFNDLTMLPLYLIQRLFYQTDLGNGYFAVARNPDSGG